jgi:hypothetical protein
MLLAWRSTPTSRASLLRRLTALALLSAMIVMLSSASASAARLTRAQQSYLAVVERGFQQVGEHWTNRRFHWFNSVMNDHARYPLASVWDTVPLFEAADETATASASAMNVGRVVRFANYEERYWDRAVRPYPGARFTSPAYAPYPNSFTNINTYFDDNSWLGLAFLDARQVMEQTDRGGLASRYLRDAERAFDFVEKWGWDSADGGGIWWNTYHIIPGGNGRSGEALASSTDLAARLYQITHQGAYLQFATRNIVWANQNLENWDGGYGLVIPNSMEMPDDGEGALISAYTTLCQAGAAVPAQVYAGIPLNDADPRLPSDRLPADPGSWCSWAQELAQNYTYGIKLWVNRVDSHLSMDEGPQWDDIYVRGLLSLYGYSHSPNWYQVASYQAWRILHYAQSAPGMFMRSWDGSTSIEGTPAGSLRVEASSLSVLAALAATAPPGA